MRRVVVTGLGMVTPLACGVESTWRRLLAGESGIGRVETFEVADIPCKIAGQVPRGDGTDGTFNPDQWMEPKEQRKVDDFILFAMAAATQALDDADWHPREYEDQITSGVLIGSGIGGIVGNLAAKFLFEGHDELDRVETVGAEIVDETGVLRHLVGLDAEMLNDDLLNPLANITHRFQPLLSTRPDNNVSVRPSLPVPNLGDTQGFRSW